MALRFALVTLLALMLGQSAQAGPPAPRSVCETGMLERLLAGPLVETPTDKPGEAFVVLYSGDGGWAQADCEFARRLAGRGLPVIGVNSVRYFARARTPEVAAVDLSRTIDAYAARWDRPKVILMGYSFGASALPLIAEKLPAAELARVSQIALAGPGAAADFVLRPRTWFGHLSSNAQPFEPALQRLEGVPVVCIYGEHDPTAACPRLSGVTVRQVPGGHRFHGAYQAVVDAVTAAS